MRLFSPKGLPNNQVLPAFAIYSGSRALYARANHKMNEMVCRLLCTFLLACLIGKVYAQDDNLAEAQNLAAKYVTDHQLRDINNAFVDHQNVIHIFIYQDFSSLLKGIPTTATEKHRFQVHLLVSEDEKDLYALQYVGKYNPVFTFDGLDPSVRGRSVAKIVMVDFPVAGPYTETVQLHLKRRTGVEDGMWRVANPITINISKTVYGSIGYGLLYSSLVNPTNIRPMQTNGGEPTLVADDTQGRGLSTILATFYPWGRNNLMIPSWSFLDRFGIVLGTAIGKESSPYENFFLGGQFDFAIGGSVISGVHYGKRQRIVGVSYRKFTFGETQFTGNVEALKYSSWDFGIFIGLQVDSRIFSQIFNVK